MRHRVFQCPVIALSPLLQATFKIGVIKPTDPRNRANAFGVWAMASYTGCNILLWHAALIDGFAPRHEFAVSVVGRPGRQIREIDRQGMCRCRAEIGCCAPHVLLRKWSVARVTGEAGELLVDVYRPLARQTWVPAYSLAPIRRDTKCNCGLGRFPHGLRTQMRRGRLLPVPLFLWRQAFIV